MIRRRWNLKRLPAFPTRDHYKLYTKSLALGVCALSKVSTQYKEHHVIIGDVTLDVTEDQFRALIKQSVMPPVEIDAYEYDFDGHAIHVGVESNGDVNAYVDFDDEVAARIFEFPWAKMVNPIEII